MKAVSFLLAVLLSAVVAPRARAQSGPPVVTLQPDPLTLVVGDPFYLVVNADGSAPLSYQWQRNNVNVAGAVDYYYPTNGHAATGSDAGSWRCIITNDFGRATSSVAVVTVFVPPDRKSVV